MDRSPDHVPCEAKICKNYKDYAKGCVYVPVALNSRGKCKFFVRSKPYPRRK